MKGTGLRGAIKAAGAKGAQPLYRLAVKPVWIHDLLILWRRNQARTLLLEHAADYVAQEIRSAAVRQAVLAQIAADFVETRGRGRFARTLPQNVWATYSRNFPSAALAPAYWVHLAAGWPLAYVMAAAWGTALTPGDVLDDALLTAVIGTEPDPASLADLDACLRTLYYFGVLALRRNSGRYVYAKRIAVPPPIFPLLVWTWWQQQGVSTVSRTDFAQSPLFAFVDSADFAAGWAAAEGKVWTTDATGQTVQLLPRDRAAFERTLLNLLSTEGRKGRDQPRDGEPPELPEETAHTSHL